MGIGAVGRWEHGGSAPPASCLECNGSVLQHLSPPHASRHTFIGAPFTGHSLAFIFQLYCGLFRPFPLCSPSLFLFPIPLTLLNKHSWCTCYLRIAGGLRALLKNTTTRRYQFSGPSSYLSAGRFVQSVSVSSSLTLQLLMLSVMMCSKKESRITIKKDEVQLFILQAHDVTCILR